MTTRQDALEELNQLLADERSDSQLAKWLLDNCDVVLEALQDAEGPDGRSEEWIKAVKAIKFSGDADRPAAASEREPVCALERIGGWNGHAPTPTWRCNVCNYRGDHDAHPGCRRVAPPAAPEGWRLVPVELADMMRNAAWVMRSGSFDDIYQAMLAASPSPASERELPEPAPTEPVAWRYVHKKTQGIVYTEQPPDRVSGLQEYAVTPLYAAPPPEKGNM